MASHITTQSDNHHRRSPAPSTDSDNSRRVRRDAAASEMSEKVPLVTINDKPPMAGPEIDDLDSDDRDIVSKPYPGVDDGFFNGSSDNHNGNRGEDNPDLHHDIDDIPMITSRAGPDGGSEMPDENDGQKKPEGLHPNSFSGRFPSYGRDLETGSMVPDLDSIPDVNVYQHKKTLAQGMMDLALFSANANQLRYVLETFSSHPYYYPSTILLSFSLLLQVAIGVGLIWNATYNVKDDKEICIANKINNFTVIGIFLVTVVNVFISAFGVANAPATPTV